MATITVDWDLGFSFQIHDITLDDASNSIVFDPPQESVAPLILRITQGAGGSKLATWPSELTWAAGVPPTLSTTSGSVDVFWFIAIDTGSGFQYHGAVFALDIL